MIIDILLLILGFILLIKCADLFVDGASSTAQNFKVSKMLIGLTIVAFGTSAPEFAVSMSALANKSSDMVLGNVIGSCILNTMLIIGIAAIIHPIKIHDNTVKKELPLTLLISTLLAILMLDVKLGNGLLNQLTRSDAFVILLFFMVFLYYLFTLLKQKRDNEKEKPKYKLWLSLVLIAIGLSGIIFGSDLVVDSASSIAKSIGVTERVIALTIIAFGTSLPELVTTIVSSKKGEQDLLMGNIIGSNIFNICVVLGIPIAIYGTVTPASFSVIDLIMLVTSALLMFLFARSGRTVNRFEGILMITVFALYYILVFIL